MTTQNRRINIPPKCLLKAAQPQPSMLNQQTSRPANTLLLRSINAPTNRTYTNRRQNRRNKKRLNRIRRSHHPRLSINLRHAIKASNTRLNRNHLLRNSNRLMTKNTRLTHHTTRRTNAKILNPMRTIARTRRPLPTIRRLTSVNLNITHTLSLLSRTRCTQKHTTIRQPTRNTSDTESHNNSINPNQNSRTNNRNQYIRTIFNNQSRMNVRYLRIPQIKLTAPTRRRPLSGHTNLIST